MNSQHQQKVFNVLVVGGGLSGLVIGQGLQQLQLEWKLLEARPILGGRLANDKDALRIDMGGAWMWPDHQPHMRELTKLLKLKTFQQPDDPSSTRIDGGAVMIVDKLSEQVDNDRIQLNSPVSACRLQQHKSKLNWKPLVEVETIDGTVYVAEKVIFAVPPKVLANHVTFDPPLSDAKQHAMKLSQTWMVGVTKVALIYPYRFWDLTSSNMGLPEGMGPAFQVYDSSTLDEKISSLTFFTLVPPNIPAMSDDSVLAKEVAEQMARMWSYFGKSEFAHRVRSFSGYQVYRWPLEKYISEDPFPTNINPHPTPVRALSEPEWDGALYFAGTETDLHSPGVMEGAVSSAKRVLKSLVKFCGRE